MPNIEVHGLYNNNAKVGYVGYHIWGSDPTNRNLVLSKLSSTIKESILPWKDQVVITEFNSSCNDLEDNSMPFLRVCSTDREEINALVQVLEPLQMDIETLLLTGFYPGKVGKIHGKKANEKTFNWFDAAKNKK
jgi:hypothetical protein